MPQVCSARVVGAGLSPHIACGNSAALPPSCDKHTSWTEARVFNGSDMHSLNRRHKGVAPDSAAVCAQRAFDSYMCGLEVHGRHDGYRPADWAFGEDPPTVGKFVARIAMRLYLGITSSSNPLRPVLASSTLRTWRWRPANGCPARANREAQADSAWLLVDVCSAHTMSGHGASSNAGSGGSGSRPLRHIERILDIVRGNTSGSWPTGSDLMWMATAGGGETLAG